MVLGLEDTLAPGVDLPGYNDLRDRDDKFMKVAEGHGNDLMRLEEMKRLHLVNLPPKAKDKIREEAALLVDVTKRNLAAVVQTNVGTASINMAFSCIFKIRKNSLPISDDDRATIISLLYEAIQIPTLDHTEVNELFESMTRMLQGREAPYFSMPEGWYADWRVFYKIIKKRLLSGTRQANVMPQPAPSKAMSDVVSAFIPFFTPESTEEILAELRPFLHLQDHASSFAICMYTTMLPTRPSIVRSDLWLSEAVSICHSTSRNPMFLAMWVDLFTRLARDNPGKGLIDPHLPFLFTLILHHSGIPVGSRGCPASPEGFFPTSCEIFLDDGNVVQNIITNIVDICVYSVGPGEAPAFLTEYQAEVTVLEDDTHKGDDATMDGAKTPQSEEDPFADPSIVTAPAFSYLVRLLKYLEPYFHPSVAQQSEDTLSALLNAIITCCACRLERRRWLGSPIPEEMHLKQKDRDAFVDLVRPLALQILFSENQRVLRDAVQCISGMCSLSPRRILPQLLAKCYSGLTTVTETHKTASVLAALSAVSQTLTNTMKFPEGASHLAELLPLVLPGIDANDPLKTFHTLSFLSGVFTNVVVKDVSSHEVNMEEAKAALADNTPLYSEASQWKKWKKTTRKSDAPCPSFPCEPSHPKKKPRRRPHHVQVSSSDSKLFQYNGNGGILKTGVLSGAVGGCGMDVESIEGGKEDKAPEPKDATITESTTTEEPRPVVSMDEYMDLIDQDSEDEANQPLADKGGCGVTVPQELQMPATFGEAREHARQLTRILPEYTLLVFKKILQLCVSADPAVLDNQPQAKEGGETKSGSELLGHMASFCCLMFASCCPLTLDELSREFVKFVRENVVRSAAGTMRCIAIALCGARPATQDELIPLCVSRVEEELASREFELGKAAPTLSEKSMGVFIWFISVGVGAFAGDNYGRLKYWDQYCGMVRKFAKVSYAPFMGVFRTLLTGFRQQMEVKELHPLPPSLWNNSEVMNHHWMYWGRRFRRDEIAMEWVSEDLEIKDKVSAFIRDIHPSFITRVSEITSLSTEGLSKLSRDSVLVPIHHTVAIYSAFRGLYPFLSRQVTDNTYTMETVPNRRLFYTTTPKGINIRYTDNTLGKAAEIHNNFSGRSHEEMANTDLGGVLDMIHYWTDGEGLGVSVEASVSPFLNVFLDTGSVEGTPEAATGPNIPEADPLFGHPILSEGVAFGFGDGGRAGVLLPESGVGAGGEPHGVSPVLASPTTGEPVRLVKGDCTRSLMTNMALLVFDWAEKHFEGDGTLHPMLHSVAHTSHTLNSPSSNYYKNVRRFASQLRSLHYSLMNTVRFSRFLHVQRALSFRGQRVRHRDHPTDHHVARCVAISASGLKSSIGHLRSLAVETITSFAGRGSGVALVPYVCSLVLDKNSERYTIQACLNVLRRESVLRGIVGHPELLKLVLNTILGFQQHDSPVVQAMVTKIQNNLNNVVMWRCVPLVPGSASEMEKKVISCFQGASAPNAGDFTISEETFKRGTTTLQKLRRNLHTGMRDVENMVIGILKDKSRDIHWKYQHLLLYGVTSCLSAPKLFKKDVAERTALLTPNLKLTSFISDMMATGLSSNRSIAYSVMCFLTIVYKPEHPNSKITWHSEVRERLRRGFKLKGKTPSEAEAEIERLQSIPRDQWSSSPEYPYTTNPFLDPVTPRAVHARINTDHYQINYEAAGNAEAYSQHHFMDDSFMGYNGMPRSRKVFGVVPKEGEPGDNSHPQNWSPFQKVIASRFLDQGFLADVLKMMVGDSVRSSSALCIQLWKGLFQHLGEPLWDTMYPLIFSMVQCQKRPCRQFVAAEVVAGLTRGIKHWPFTRRTRVFKKLFPLLQCIMEDTVLPETLDVWTWVALSASYDLDPVRVLPLLRFAVSKRPVSLESHAVSPLVPAQPPTRGIPPAFAEYLVDVEGWSQVVAETEDAVAKAGNLVAVLPPGSPSPSDPLTAGSSPPGKREPFPLPAISVGAAAASDEAESGKGEGEAPPSKEPKSDDILLKYLTLPEYPEEFITSTEPITSISILDDVKTAPAVLVARRVLFMEPVISELSWHAQAVNSVAVDMVLSLRHHPLQAVRERLTGLLVTVSRAFITLERDGSGSDAFAAPRNPPLHPCLGKIIDTITEDLIPGGASALFALEADEDSPNGVVDEKDALPFSPLATSGLLSPQSGALRSSFQLSPHTGPLSPVCMSAVGPDAPESRTMHSPTSCSFPVSRRSSVDAHHHLIGRAAAQMDPVSESSSESVSVNPSGGVSPMPALDGEEADGGDSDVTMGSPAISSAADPVALVPIPHPATMSPSVGPVRRNPTDMPSALSLAEASKDDIDVNSEGSVNLKPVRQLTVQWLYDSMQESNNLSRQFLPRIFPALLSMRRANSDTTEAQLSFEVDASLLTVSHAMLPSSTAGLLLSHAVAASKAKDWRIRVEALHCAQVLLFRHSFLLPSCVATDFVKTLVGMFDDPRSDVRQLASVTMSSVLAGVGGGAGDNSDGEKSGSTIQKILKVFRALCKTPLTKSLKSKKRAAMLKKGATPSEITAEIGRRDQKRKHALRRRHIGVLGLCAVVNAFPHHVPKWMTTVLAELASHRGESHDITSTLRDAFAQFKASHRDTWPQDRLLFTEDQLMLITDLMVSPTYYA